MKTLFARILISAIILASMGAQAQTTFIGDRHKHLDQLTQTYDKPNERDEDSREARTFIAQCGAVAPFAGFCKCLARKLPPGLSFQQYFVVLSRTKEQNNYESLAPQVRQTYDSIPVIRDECVAIRVAP